MTRSHTTIHKILVMGLPGAGKTTLATALCRRLPAVHFNADAVRAQINKDLGFSEADRIEQARRMGWLCDQVAKAQTYVVADFVCPTAAARDAFVSGGPAFVVWMDRIQHSRFDDTNRLFMRPARHDLRVGPENTPDYWVEEIVERLQAPANV